MIVGRWVETPDGLGKVLEVRPVRSWIFRRQSTQVWVRVELITGERRQFRPDQIAVRP
jgi:hypothetical protein